LSLDPWDGETFLRIYYKMGAGISKKAAMEAVDANTGRLTLLDMVAEQEDVSVYTRKQCSALATHLDNMRYETAGRAIYRIMNS
jgi:DNA helicase-2/ATP-dependent DNA helicase PcrA